MSILFANTITDFQQGVIPVCVNDGKANSFCNNVVNVLIGLGLPYNLGTLETITDEISEVLDGYIYLNEPINDLTSVSISDTCDVWTPSLPCQYKYTKYESYLQPCNSCQVGCCGQYPIGNQNQLSSGFYTGNEYNLDSFGQNPLAPYKTSYPCRYAKVTYTTGIDDPNFQTNLTKLLIQMFYAVGGDLSWNPLTMYTAENTRDNTTKKYFENKNLSQMNFANVGKSYPFLLKFVQRYLPKNTKTFF